MTHDSADARARGNQGYAEASAVWCFDGAVEVDARRRRRMRLRGGVTLAVAVLLGLVTFGLAQVNLALDASDATARATVTEVDMCSRLARRCLHEAQLTYRTEDGARVVASSTELDWEPVPVPGERITVVYDVDNPRNAVREIGVHADWYLVVLGGVVVVLMGAAGLAGLLGRLPAWGGWLLLLRD